MKGGSEMFPTLRPRPLVEQEPNPWLPVAQLIAIDAVEHDWLYRSCSAEGKARLLQDHLASIQRH